MIFPDFALTRRDKYNKIKNFIMKYKPNDSFYNNDTKIQVIILRHLRKKCRALLTMRGGDNIIQVCVIIHKSKCFFIIHKKGVTIVML